MMRITPKSDGEIREKQEENAKKFGPWPSGVYDAEILIGFDTESKAGNPMLELEVQAFDQSGNTKKIKDYIVESMDYKVRHLCYSAGLGNDYEAGEIPGHIFSGQTCKVKLGIDPGQNGYPPKNKIVDYVTEESTPARSTAKPPAPRTATAASTTRTLEDLDDDIPF